MHAKVELQCVALFKRRRLICLLELNGGLWATRNQTCLDTF